MAVNPDPTERLACGRDAAAVWDRAAAGERPDDHERGCPHCRLVAADARGLDALVHRLAEQPLAPPPSVLDRVMRAVRTEPRSHELLTLPTEHGPARLSRAAAAGVLRHTVDGVDGVRARSCRIGQGGDPGDAHAVDVLITVTARFGVDLASVAAGVRRTVAAACEQTLGVPVRRVDIEVVDLWEP